MGIWQAIKTFSALRAGLVPASGGGTTNFLRADGTFAAPGAGPGVSINVGTATIDFSTGGQRTLVTIVGQAAILTSSTITAWLMADTTADHSDYEHQMASMFVSFTCGNIIAGTGFDVVATSTINLKGQFKIHWLWT